jgi:hypothetical protein
VIVYNIGMETNKKQEAFDFLKMLCLDPFYRGRKIRMNEFYNDFGVGPEDLLEAFPALKAVQNYVEKHAGCTQSQIIKEELGFWGLYTKRIPFSFSKGKRILEFAIQTQVICDLRVGNKGRSRLYLPHYKDLLLGD